MNETQEMGVVVSEMSLRAIAVEMPLGNDGVNDDWGVVARFEQSDNGISGNVLGVEFCGLSTFRDAFEQGLVTVDAVARRISTIRQALVDSRDAEPTEED